MAEPTLPAHVQLQLSEAVRKISNTISLKINKADTPCTTLILTTNRLIFTQPTTQAGTVILQLSDIVDQKVSPAGAASTMQMIITRDAQKYIVIYTNRATAQAERQFVKLELIEVISANTARGLTAQGTAAAAVPPKPLTPTGSPTAPSSDVRVKTEPNLATSRTPAKRGISAVTSAAPLPLSNSTTNGTARSTPPAHAPNNNDTTITRDVVNLTDSTDTAIIEARVDLLRRSADLRKSHNDLVKSGILSEDQFWAARQAELANSQSNVLAQQRGVSSNKLNTTSANGNTGKPGVTRIRLDKSDIHNIFMTKPHVHRAFTENVPLKMSEKEFWTRYIKAQRIRDARAATAAGTQQALRPDVDVSDEQFFAAYEARAPVQTEQVDAAQRVKLNRFVDPSVDLTSADTFDSLRNDENQEIDADTDAQTAVSKVIQSKRASEQSEIINRVNKHSNLVVETGHLHEHHTGVPTVNNDNELQVNNSTNLQTIAQQQYHRDLTDSLRFTDLQTSQQPDYNALSIKQSYYNTHAVELTAKTAANLHDAEQRLYKEVGGWTLSDEAEPNHQICSEPSPSICYSVLTQLSYSNRAMNSASLSNRNAELMSQQVGGQSIKIYSTAGDSSADIEVPVAFQMNLRELYNKLIELLRHYWLCFPVAPANRNQMEKLKIAIDEHGKYIQSYRSTLYADNLAPLVQLVTPLQKAIEKADDAYDEFRRKEAELRQRIQAQQAARLAQQQKQT